MHDCAYGSYYFENEEGVTETANTVNGERYRNMLNTFLTPFVEQMDSRNELWFEQDETRVAAHLTHIFRCCKKCLARIAYPKDAHYSAW